MWLPSFPNRSQKTEGRKPKKINESNRLHCCSTATKSKNNNIPNNTVD